MLPVAYQSNQTFTSLSPSHFFPRSLQVSLGEDLAAALTDGVVLCHIANHVSPRAVSSIHVPSPAVVSLTLIRTHPTHVHLYITTLVSTIFKN